MNEYTFRTLASSGTGDEDDRFFTRTLWQRLVDNGAVYDLKDGTPVVGVEEAANVLHTFTPTKKGESWFQRLCHRK